MKKLMIFSIGLIISTLVIGQPGVSIHPYARLGLNLTPPTLEDLDFVGYSGENIEMNPVIIGLGVQLKKPYSGNTYGLDIGGGSLFVNKVINDQGVGTSTHLDKEYDIYFHFFIEKKSGILFYQLGGGPHFTPWYYMYYYDSENYRDVYDDYGGVAVTVGLTGAFGTQLAVSDKAGFFILGRLDAIFQYGVMLPLTVNAGFTLDL